MLDYRIEVYDTGGRRIAVFDEVALLEATRSTPDAPDLIRGMLPGTVRDLSHGYRIRVIVGDERFCDAFVTAVRPQWSDLRKLILDRYVSFHEVFEFEAERPAYDGNTTVSRGYANRPISAIAKSVINSALGPLHYQVAHGRYPDGAEREYEKFLARKLPDNELEVGGVSQGQWVGSNRIDASSMYVKDGDTISGVIVDGVPWPDLRLMMIDTEELTRNSHAQSWHPEVAAWSNAEYAASGYKLRADAAKAALQALIDSKGIDYIELNPHRGPNGEFDDRVDMYGRYIALIYGGGQCFNAAMVEQGLAIVYQWDDGKYHVPEMELKDYFSYVGECTDSVEETPVTLAEFDVVAGAIEILTALAYAADGFVWTVDPDLAVTFRAADRADQVLYFDPLRMGVGLGSDSSGVGNVLYFDGNPEVALKKTYRRWPSVDAYGARIMQLSYFPIVSEEDADRLAEGLLDDVAYPEPCGFVQFYQGDDTVKLGDIVELRDGPLRRLEREVSGEWGGRFTGKLVGRVARVTHRFSGKQVTTTVWLTSPLRSVGNPTSVMVRSQESKTDLYQFRLDDASVGLDMGYHLD